jgi:multiple sugar transport system substrate-binding protein
MNRRIGNRRLACVAVLLLGVLVSGCKGDTSPPAEPATITFAHWRDIDAERYRALARAFNERHPHITVEVRELSIEERIDPTTINADTFWLTAGYVRALADEGSIVSLGAHVDQDASFDPSDFLPGLLADLTIDGETWAIPSGVDVTVLFYNRDLFDRYGVPYPQAGWTWDDFLGKALALHDPDATAMGERVEIFGYGTTSHARAALQCVYQHGGGIVDDIYAPTRVTFDDPLTVGALEWFADLYHAHGVAPTPTEALQAFGRASAGSPAFSLYNGIQAGRIAMWEGTFSGRGGDFYVGDWFFDWGMVPLPGDARSAALRTVEGYVISSQTRHPDECWQWTSFLSHEILPGAIPPRRTLAESDPFEQLVGDGEALVALTALEGGLPFPVGVDEFLAAFGVFDQAVEEIVEEATPPLEALTRALQQMEE